MIPKEENGLFLRGKEDILESGSGSELQVEDKPGNEENSSEQPLKKKRYHRHTARQIQEMEAVFKECPHPDDKQRMRLSQELGLKPRQVKFWFQNRRTQMKAQQDRSENAILRAENDSLKNEFFRLQAELSKLVCPNCGGPPVPGSVSFEQLRIENARLAEELERNKWNQLFPSIVARAKCVQVISPGVSGTNGSLQLLAMSGEDPSCIPLLPLGFFITPMELIKDDGGCTGEANGHMSAAGSLLTVGLQVLASTNPSSKINLSSIAAINNHLCTTVHQISAALGSSSGTLRLSCPDNSAAANAPEK
ncbi:hypothetical protein V6N11_031053 [Hibiscus sabdariffa]|uniref:Homeobox domain-containing protein n=1 Tax=Hibiscus sabdariffa TaxID=183260 RepID=A0ABR2AC70_9ROSI